jgi:hypothetical protein
VQPAASKTATPVLNGTQPAPDSEEARLAAAAVRTGTDNPLDAVIDQAFTQGQQRIERERAARGAPPEIPLKPAREDVLKAMQALLPAIRDCAQGQLGLATVSMVVSNAGKIQMVGLTGQPFGGTASGQCMEHVVMSAQFPRFQQPSFRVQFPFLLQ